MGSVCTFIGVGYEPEMLEFHKTSHNYVGSHHSELIFKPLDRSNMYRWKQNLKPKEARVFNLLSRHYLKKYGYEPGEALSGLTDILYLVKTVSLGLPQRLSQVVRIKRIRERALAKGLAVDPLFPAEPPRGSNDRGVERKEDGS
jgi:hypothetical protein